MSSRPETSSHSNNLGTPYLLLKTEDPDFSQITWEGKI